MFFADGTIYSGEWKDNKSEGNGRLHHPNRDFYIG